MSVTRATATLASAERSMRVQATGHCECREIASFADHAAGNPAREAGLMLVVRRVSRCGAGAYFATTAKESPRTPRY